MGPGTETTSMTPRSVHALELKTQMSAPSAMETDETPTQLHHERDSQASQEGMTEIDDFAEKIQLRDPKERVVYKMSVKLIDTYKYINKVALLLQ